MTLRFLLPETYPASTPPTISLPSSSPPAILTRESVIGQLTTTAEETHSSGNPQIFDLIDTARDLGLSLLKSARLSVRADKAAATAKREAIAQQVHDAKFGGTKVTKEKFMDWWNTFSAELAAAKKAKHADDERDDGTAKLTGRQLWERGLAGQADVDAAGA